MVVAALLCACNGDHQSRDSFASKPVHAIPQIPPTRQLRIALPTGTFPTIDFMALHGCALQITLGKYQSRLGRFASDSQRLLLDLEYLSLAPDCIALKQREHELALAEQLRQEHQLKLRQLPSLVFNATLANTEFQQFWSRRSGRRANTEQFRLTLSAITEVNASTLRWLHGDYQASNIEFEIQLSEIRKGKAVYMQSEIFRATVVNLEEKIRAALPLEYRLWRELRHTYLQDLYLEQS
jgi:hypothetical protein